MKYRTYFEYLIRNHLGEECQRFIGDIFIKLKFIPNSVTGFYDQAKDQLILVYPHFVFHIIPENRDKSRLLWHEYHTFKNASMVPLGYDGKIWILGGQRAKMLQPVQISHHTQIYDIE